MTSATSGASITVTHPVGLNTQTSVKFTQLAKTFAATLEIADAPGGPWVDAKGVVEVMALKIPRGATLYLRGAGAGATEAVSALTSLVQRDFDLDGTGDDPG